MLHRNALKTWVSLKVQKGGILLGNSCEGRGAQIKSRYPVGCVQQQLKYIPDDRR